jgi:soluble lytic murein transglycosylase-like protein
MKNTLFFYKKMLAFFAFFCILSLHASDSFAAKKGMLVLPNGVKVEVDLSAPIYITKKVDGKIYYWVYNPKTQKSAPAKFKGNTGQFDHIVEKASKTFGVNPKLIHSVIRHESGYNPRAVSHAGAQGLMQLIPGTAERMGVDDAFDPYENIMGGTKYLRLLLDMFEGNPVHAVAAYNAGEGRVKQYNGIPPFAETKQYVARVMKDFWHN